MKRDSLKLNKSELAEALAEALNQLNDIRAGLGEHFTQKQENDYNTLIVNLLKRNEEIRKDFANNGTLIARDLI